MFAWWCTCAGSVRWHSVDICTFVFGWLLMSFRSIKALMRERARDITRAELDLLRGSDSTKSRVVENVSTRISVPITCQMSSADALERKSEDVECESHPYGICIMECGTTPQVPSSKYPLKLKYVKWEPLLLNEFKEQLLRDNQ